MFKLDFTVSLYQRFLNEFLGKGYFFYSFSDYLKIKKPECTKIIILRHDVDKKPWNSLITASIENELNIKGTYYFRIVKESNNPEVIKKIAGLGHEIGYHYEDFVLARGNAEKAKKTFINNLSYFRTFYPVETICMHGSPLSKYDNREIWKNFSYNDYGVIGEPFFDVDFNKMLYLTDTGRTWNSKYSLRDFALSSLQSDYHSTFDIFNDLRKDKLPDEIMVTIHSQRWTSNMLDWLTEFTVQKLKNNIKVILKAVR